MQTIEEQTKDMSTEEKKSFFHKKYVEIYGEASLSFTVSDEEKEQAVLFWEEQCITKKDEIEETRRTISKAIKEYEETGDIKEGMIVSHDKGFLSTPAALTRFEE